MRPHLRHTFRLTLRPDGTHLLRLVDVVRYWDLAATERPSSKTALFHWRCSRCRRPRLPRRQFNLRQVRGSFLVYPAGLSNAAVAKREKPQVAGGPDDDGSPRGRSQAKASVANEVNPAHSTIEDPALRC